MQNKLPPEWIDSIFKRFHGRFGNAFLSKFAVGQVDEKTGEDVGVLNAKEVWAQELGHLSPERIGKALSAKYDYPPSSDDFVKAATPVPACHRDNAILALPRPKADSEVVQKNLEKIRAMMNIKKVTA